MPTERLTTAPGVGGRLRDHPEDFLVEELPLYDFAGEGEHRFLLVEKRGLATSQAINVIARTFRIRPRDIGCAGLKDRHAVTRQWFSIHADVTSAIDAAALDGPNLRVVDERRHTNKLKRGHLAGNRFEIRIRDADGPAADARTTLEHLARLGAPNFFGDQRFGVRRNNHLVGRALLLGEHEEFLAELLSTRHAQGMAEFEARRLYESGDLEGALHAFPPGARTEMIAIKALMGGRKPKSIFGAFDKTTRSFWLSALQSAVFNRVLGARLNGPGIDALAEGDLAVRHNAKGAGPTFEVDAATVAEPETRARLDDFEISPTGPLWGPEMRRASGTVDQVERDALADLGVSVEAIDAFTSRHGKSLIPGERRSLRARVTDIGVEEGEDEHGRYIACRFALPAGSFATVVMDCIMRGGVTSPVGAR
jgi:tRNA pseudouridine13 synthase